MARHGGTDHVQGQLNRGTAKKPSPYHHGSGKPLGGLHGPPGPRKYGLHGGTAAPMGQLKKRKFT